MKHLIVLVATVMLGITIGGVVLGFGQEAKDIGDAVRGNISDVLMDFDAVSGGG